MGVFFKYKVTLSASERCYTVGITTPPGYYMYIETSLPRVLGDRAKLTSHWFSVSGNQCTFSFFYHMEVIGCKIKVSRILAIDSQNIARCTPNDIQY